MSLITTPVTVRSIATIGLNLAAIHSITSAYILGSSIWHSFIGGPLTYVTIPRLQFGNVQARLFPVLFGSHLALSAGLLASWLSLHPSLTKPSLSLSNWRSPDAFNAWLLIAMILGSGANFLYVGPKTSQVMKERHKLERSEGKSYDAQGISPTMQSLNKQFSVLHSISSIINLAFLGAALVHQAFLGHYAL